MNAEFHLNADDLNISFLKSIKALFKGRKISVVIEPELDETEYLLASKANKQMLLDSIQEIENGKVVTTTLDDLLKLK